jgi:flagellar FliL protein
MSKEAEQKAPPAPAAAAAASGGGGGKLVVAIAIGVLNLGGTGFLAFQQLRADKARPAAEAAEAKPDKEKHAAAQVMPAVTFDPFVVNLNEPGSNRYLKATVEVEVEDQKAAEDLKGAKRAVRDDLLRYLSSLAVADTQGETAKQKMEQQMLARIDKQLGGEKAHRLFFTEFMVQ